VLRIESIYTPGGTKRRPLADETGGGRMIRGRWGKKEKERGPSGLQKGPSLKTPRRNALLIKEAKIKRSGHNTPSNFRKGKALRRGFGARRPRGWTKLGPSRPAIFCAGRRRDRGLRDACKNEFARSNESPLTGRKQSFKGGGRRSKQIHHSVSI